MSDRNPGLTLDALFVAATRPPMRWGVTYSALLFNLVFTMEAFLLTKNLLTLLMALPIHGICALLCLREPRIFDLFVLWMRTRLLAHVSNYRYWKASSGSPLAHHSSRIGRRYRKIMSTSWDTEKFDLWPISTPR